MRRRAEWFIATWSSFFVHAILALRDNVSTADLIVVEGHDGLA